MSIHSLPTEILMIIQQSLPTIRDCTSFSQTCQNFYHASPHYIRFRNRIPEYPELVFDENFQTSIEKNVILISFKIARYDFDKNNEMGRLCLRFDSDEKMQSLCKEIVAENVSKTHCDKIGLFRNDNKIRIDIDVMPDLKLHFVTKHMFTPLLMNKKKNHDLKPMIYFSKNFEITDKQKQ